MCIRFENNDFPVHTAVHEMGHHIADSYGVGKSLFDSCRRRAVREGYADAFAVLAGHYLHSRGRSYSTTVRDELLQKGITVKDRYMGPPGDRQELRFFFPDTRPSPACVNCNNAPEGEAYAIGADIGEVLWQFLINRRCEWLGVNQCQPMPLLNNSDLAASIGRESLTFAIIVGRNDRHGVRHFLQTMLLWAWVRTTGPDRVSVAKLFSPYL